MKVVVGLGNPGPKYRGTRHNIGFAIVDELARRAAVAFESAPVDALVAKWRRPDAGDAVLLAKPLTFMNRSGEAVGGLLRYFKVEPSELLVIVDEVQLPLARLRARPSGSAGGHNGLRSLRASLGTGEFYRVRVGVGRPPGRQDVADFVLSDYSSVERKELPFQIGDAADAVEMLVQAGLAQTQQRFNS